jgi:hypothetical protein
MRIPMVGRGPLPGLGMGSLVPGFIALVLAILPVLGIPISACGLVLGILGVVVAVLGGGSLRWSLAGIAVCALALVVNVALADVPAHDLPGRSVPRPWPSVPDRPYVAPPAKG